MGTIIGIDLGTTYSSVAIPGERTGDGFYIDSKCPGNTVILDRLKRRTTPSVVALNDKGQIVVGYTAKGRAGMSPEPCMFVKRYMGLDKKFDLGPEKSWGPEQVSAEILKYLKSIAEERLGEPVTEAVITVPAYFGLPAKQMTEKAGELAGLKVLALIMEPVAAAMMYCLNDKRDPLTILTYDLGGGTFDVAILKKSDGIITERSILAFDGDPALGGYNFDMKLALWILDRLVDQGYDLKYDENDPADKVIFAKLLVYAEQAKRKLSTEQVYEIQENTTGIKDRSGNDVVIELAVTREDFVELIKDDVEYTLELCRRAMEEKASPPIDPDEIDEIVMVGGSSRIPLIQQRLEVEFGRKPLLVEPELCIALGAAINAGSLGQTIGCLKLNLIPSCTEFETLVVSGQVIPTADLADVDGCRVTLRAVDYGYENTRNIGPQGGFVFDSVPLIVDSTREFTLAVTSPAGVELVSYNFSVTQGEGGAGKIVDPPKVLAKPIYVLMKDGMHLVAPELTRLPFEAPVHAQTTGTSGTIRLEVYEEHHTLGVLIMDNIPKTLSVGTPVDITMVINEDYSIDVRAYIPSLARDEKINIEIPIPPVKTIDELRDEYSHWVKRADDVLTSAGRGFLIDNAKALNLEKRLQECGRMLDGRAPDPVQIANRLDEIKSLIRELGAGWRPSPDRDTFENKAGEADRLLAEVIKVKPEVEQDGYDRQIGAIRAEADKAYKDQNDQAWSDSFNKMVALCDRLHKLLPNGSGARDLTPEEHVIQMSKILTMLHQMAIDADRYEEFEDRFEDLKDSLEKIDPKAADFSPKARDWYNKFMNLQADLGRKHDKNLEDILGLRKN